MELPVEISLKILQLLEMPELNQTTESKYTGRLQVLRKQMRQLAADFMACKPSEKQYTDAYFAYNFPMNLAKTMVVAKEIGKRFADMLADRARLNVLDIGCGDGAGICGLYYALKETRSIQEFRFLGVDSSGSMLERARVLAKWISDRDARFKIYLRKQRIEDLNTPEIRKQHDIIICVNSLAEIIRGDNIPMRFIRSMLRVLVDNGLLIIIEPALKGNARRLMRLRNELVTSRKAHVILPCLHRDQCALLMVEKRDEWCHQFVSWSPPEFLKIINHGLNREIDVLKFAYLVITKSDVQYNRPECYRVVSRLLKEKGKSRCFICTRQGLVELVLLSRSKTQLNASFDSIRKSDILQLHNFKAKKKNHWQVTEKTSVEIMK